MSATERSVATILAELAEVRRYLHDAPPHHGGGARALHDQLDRLEAELARVRRPQGGTDRPSVSPQHPPSTS